MGRSASPDALSYISLQDTCQTRSNQGPQAMHHRRAQNKERCLSQRSDKRCALYIHAHPAGVCTYMLHGQRRQGNKKAGGAERRSRTPPRWLTRFRRGRTTACVCLGVWSRPFPPLLPTHPCFPPMKQEAGVQGGKGAGGGCPRQINDTQGCAAWKGSRKAFQVSLLVSGTQHAPTCSRWTRSYPSEIAQN